MQAYVEYLELHTLGRVVLGMAPEAMTIWFYSDPHFGQNCSSWEPPRPFASVEEMDETIIEKHNALVKPADHVYCLGDFAMSRQSIERCAPRLNGKKRLILGNHDVFPLAFYEGLGFTVMGSRRFENVPIWFSHFPIAPWSFGIQVANVHGHSHGKKPLVYTVAQGEGFVRSKIYVNLSLENTHYQPVSLEALVSLVDHA